MILEKAIRLFSYAIGFAIFGAFIFGAWLFFHGGISIFDFYFSWKILMIPVFYIVSLIIMEWIFKRLNIFFQAK